MDLRRNMIGVAGLMALNLSMKMNSSLVDVALDKELEAEQADAAGEMELYEMLKGEISSACENNQKKKGGSSK